VFFVASVSSGATLTPIEEVGTSGGSLVDFENLSSSQAVTAPLATDGTSLYWVDETFTFSNDGGPVTGHAVLLKAPVGGGAPQTLIAWDSPYSWILAVDPVNVYAAGAGSASGGGVIVKVPVGGGELTTLATATAPQSIATDGSNVYWTETPDCMAGGSLRKVPVGGGTVVTIASAPMVVCADSVAVDATSVYWVNAASNGSTTEGMVLKAPK